MRANSVVEQSTKNAIKYQKQDFSYVWGLRQVQSPRFGR